MLRSKKFGPLAFVFYWSAINPANYIKGFKDFKGRGALVIFFDNSIVFDQLNT